MRNVKFPAGIALVFLLFGAGVSPFGAISLHSLKISCIVFSIAQAEAASAPDAVAAPETASAPAITPAQAAVPSPEAAPPREPTPAELAQVIEAYNRWAAGIRTVKGGGRAHVGGQEQKTRAFDFSLVLARPASARIQGRWGSLASLFDLSGDAKGWTLYLPRDRAVVHAGHERDPAGLLLPPREIVSVLLPEGIPPRDVLERGAATWEEKGVVRVVVPPGRGDAGSAFHRVLWLDAREGRPLRLEVRKRSQLEPVILRADYEDYEGRGPKAFPVKVRVNLPRDEQWMRFSFSTVRLNGAVADRLFVIRVPAGTRELAPGDLSPDFLPVADDEEARTQ